jgi:rhamnosyltransferase
MGITKEKTLATVCIPTYNGEEYLDDLLHSVFKQRVPFGFEVLVIDSGSTDNTLKILSKYPKIKLHQIPNSEFGHGKTRNLGAKLAKGKYIVYLSQDAVPASDRWLEYMCEPFMISDDVYCVFGKQTPRPNADAPTKREVLQVFNSLGPDHSISLARKQSLISKEPLENYLTFFSDVNSAVRLDYLLHKIPYRDVRYSEDQLLGSDVLDAGFIKAYAPMGEVFHSNEYSVRDYFYRKFDEYLGMYEVLGVVPGGGRAAHIKRWLRDTILDIPFIIKDKDYSFHLKVTNLATSWIRNYYRQKASYMVASPRLRHKYEDRNSLEKRRKKLR